MTIYMLNELHKKLKRLRMPRSISKYNIDCAEYRKARLKALAAKAELLLSSTVLRFASTIPISAARTLQPEDAEEE